MLNIVLCVIKRKIMVMMALLFSTMVLTACSTESEVSDWWYDQRWDTASSASLE